MDRTSTNYAVGSGDSVVNIPNSAYYPKPSAPIDVRNHPDLSPTMRINNAFSAMQDGDMDKPKQGIDDSGR